MKLPNRAGIVFAGILLSAGLLGHKMGEPGKVQEKIANQINGMIPHSNSSPFNTGTITHNIPAAAAPIKKVSEISDAELRKQSQEIHQKQNEALLKMGYSQDQINSFSDQMKTLILYKNKLAQAKTVQNIRDQVNYLSADKQFAQTGLDIRNMEIDRPLRSDSIDTQAVSRLLGAIAQHHFEQSRKKNLSLESLKDLAEADGELSYYIDCLMDFSSKQTMTSLYRLLHQVSSKTPDTIGAEELKIDGMTFPVLANYVLTLAEKTFKVDAEHLDKTSDDPITQAMIHLNEQSTSLPPQ